MHCLGLRRRSRLAWLAFDELGPLPSCRSDAISVVSEFDTGREIETCQARRISRIAPKNGRCLCTVASGISTRNASHLRCPKRTKLFGGRNSLRIVYVTRARASFSRIWATPSRQSGSAKHATLRRLVRRLVDSLRHRRPRDDHRRIPDGKAASKLDFVPYRGSGLWLKRQLGCCCDAVCPTGMRRGIQKSSPRAVRLVFREIRLRTERVPIGSLDRRGPICRGAKESHDVEDDSGKV